MLKEMIGGIIYSYAALEVELDDDIVWVAVRFGLVEANEDTGGIPSVAAVLCFLRSSRGPLQQ